VEFSDFSSTYFFRFCIICIIIVFSNFPPLSSEERAKITLPRNFDDVKEIGKILSSYTDSHYFAVMAGFISVYTFLQTFSIPGSIFLSFLAGTLFGLPVGVLVVCSVATFGATNCYLLSYYSGRNLIKKYFPEKLELFGNEVEKHKDNLFNYLLFLRFTPVIPNWFINIASPIFSVPVHYFAVDTFFGVMPQTFVAVKAGLTLQQFNSPSDVIDIRMVATLFGLAFLSLLPTLKPVKERLDRILNRKTKHS